MTLDLGGCLADWIPIKFSTFFRGAVPIDHLQIVVYRESEKKHCPLNNMPKKYQGLTRGH